MQSEFSRMIDAAKVKPSGSRLETRATDGECLAVKQRFGVESLENLLMKVDIRPWRKQGLRVEGSIQADVGQICGVSLETMSEHIDEPLSIFLLPPHLARDVPEDDDLEPPEALEDGRADIGEIALQCLSLAISPWPRKQGAALSHVESDAAHDADAGDNPFAVLGKTGGQAAD